MGHRLSKIYTKTGDQGHTDAGDGSRTPKHSVQIHCLGELDELNCAIGLTISYCQDAAITKILHHTQQQLFELGAELCVPTHPHLQEDDVLWLEQQIDHLNASLPPLKEFILPGGSLSTAHCHLARAICRRAERALISRHQQQTIKPVVLCYINRLSDLLFVTARTLATQDCSPEEKQWHNRKNTKKNTPP